VPEQWQLLVSHGTRFAVARGRSHAFSLANLEFLGVLAPDTARVPLKSKRSTSHPLDEALREGLTTAVEGRSAGETHSRPVHSSNYFDEACEEAADTVDGMLHIRGRRAASRFQRDSCTRWTASGTGLRSALSVLTCWLQTDFFCGDSKTSSTRWWRRAKHLLAGY
jgi:hypothetical protein